MTPEQEEILKRITEGVANLKTELEAIIKEKADGYGAKVTVLEEKMANLEESLKALETPANPKPLGAVDDEKGDDPSCGYKNLGEVLNDEVQRARNSVVTPRYEKLIKISEAQSKTAGTGLVEGTPQYGGNLMPEQFRTEVWDRVGSITEVINRCTIIPISGGNTLVIPAMGGYSESSGQYYGGVYFEDIGENGTATDTRPVFEQMKWELKAQSAMTHVSYPMMQHSPMSVGPFVERIMGNALAYRIEDLLINGTGEAHPIGAVTAPCGISVSAETNQQAATVNYYNIIKMDARMHRRTNAIWMYNQTVIPQLRQLSMLIGGGGDRITLDEAMGTGPRIETRFCQALGTIGDIMYIDWGENVVLVPQGQGQSAKMDTSIHFHFDTAQTSFRFIFEWDAQFAWRTAMTPRYGDTLSPVVRLATRS